MTSRIIAAIIASPVIERIVTDLGLQARALAQVQAAAHAAGKLIAPEAAPVKGPGAPASRGDSLRLTRWR